MTPVALPDILAAAPRRDPGYVSAYRAAARHASDGVLQVDPDGYKAIRASFPELPAAREYSPAEASADAGGWDGLPEPPRPPALPRRPVFRASGAPAHWGPPAWRRLQMRPRDYAGDVLAETAWIREFIAAIPSTGCGCRASAAQLLREHPPDLTSASTYARWTVAYHDHVNASLGKPAWRPDLILKTWEPLCPGDEVVFTAVVKAIQSVYSDRFRIAVRSVVPDMWHGNPRLTLERELVNPRLIKFGFDVHRKPRQHFAQMWADSIGDQLGVSIPVDDPRGDLYLSDAEREWPADLLSDRERYWLLNAGSKSDCQVKRYPDAYWQVVVDGLAGRVRLVRTGHPATPDGHHVQPALSGVIDLVGRTSGRDLIRLVHHAQGVITPISYPMHLAAALGRPCVVVAGGREPPEVWGYPGQIGLRIDLPCNARTGGCWKSHLVLVPKRESDLCLAPSSVGGVACAACMEAIPPSAVIRVVERAASLYEAAGAPAGQA